MTCSHSRGRYWGGRREGESRADTREWSGAESRGGGYKRWAAMVKSPCLGQGGSCTRMTVEEMWLGNQKDKSQRRTKTKS